MEVRITCGLWFFAFILGCGRLSAFNLDSTNVQRKNGDPGSYFGFSLAMHWQLAPEDKRMLLVGAPRAKALSGQKSKVTGGLYNCDMISTSTSCSRVQFDNNEKTNEESKENQWMGVTVNSQGPGGKVVVRLCDFWVVPVLGKQPAGHLVIDGSVCRRSGTGIGLITDKSGEVRPPGK
ncbi:integrin alpha-6-like [Notothenia coriiceps]|uniref:Integrin alpha-6-like n=1 Tax=Notothenia coriiceps TaxID=8208 RepID=A0A6I9MPK5_9TELE|nr:PREDICTED: integrin alpha-6-like [Notothenia coriiceps]